VHAARLGLRIKEAGVPRVYLDPNRAFGGVLDNAEERLAYYRRVITSEEERVAPVGVATEQSLCKLDPESSLCDPCS
jgi:dolichol-phosphate mannosyltransferase